MTPPDERKAAEEWADEIVDDCESLANEHRKPIKIKCAMALRADLLSTKLAAMEAGRLRAENERLVASLKDWNSVDASLRRNIWELDVALNGEENAAPQASLCDLIEPARRLRAENAALRERGERAIEALEAVAAHRNEDVDGNHVLWVGESTFIRVRKALAALKGANDATA